MYIIHIIIYYFARTFPHGQEPVLEKTEQTMLWWLVEHRAAKHMVSSSGHTIPLHRTHTLPLPHNDRDPAPLVDQTDNSISFINILLRLSPTVTQIKVKSIFPFF